MLLAADVGDGFTKAVSPAGLRVSWPTTPRRRPAAPQGLTGTLGAPAAAYGVHLGRPDEPAAAHYQIGETGRRAWAAEAEVTLRSVPVLPQAAGAFQYALQRDPALVLKPIGPIDVGCRKTDYLVMRRVAAGLVPNDAACGSADLAAGLVYEHLRQALTGVLADRSATALQSPRA